MSPTLAGAIWHSGNPGDSGDSGDSGGSGALGALFQTFLLAFVLSCGELGHTHPDIQCPPEATEAFTLTKSSQEKSLTRRQMPPRGRAHGLVMLVFLLISQKF